MFRARRELKGWNRSPQGKPWRKLEYQSICSDKIGRGIENGMHGVVERDSEN